MFLLPAKTDVRFILVPIRPTPFLLFSAVPLVRLELTHLRRSTSQERPGFDLWLHLAFMLQDSLSLLLIFTLTIHHETTPLVSGLPTSPP
jgi:hypothetical protein